MGLDNYWKDGILKENSDGSGGLRENAERKKENKI